ncbi:MAG: hypothetical protein ACTSUE_01665 [Promethearchaeota archaeon]
MKSISARRFKLLTIIFFLASAGVEVFSILFYQGPLTHVAPTCGSACVIWPGIPLPGPCILLCVERSTLYLPFFFMGCATAIGGIFFAMKFKLRGGKW